MCASSSAGAGFRRRPISPSCRSPGCKSSAVRSSTGNLEALDRALKILDRLDRYHGFSRASPALEPYGDDERERLLAKLNAAAARLEAKSGRNTEIREYIADDYLLLYGVRDTVIFLLAIRHHYQLSFDLRAHWL